MNVNVIKYLRHILFTIIGAGAGYLLYQFVGCPTGTCAITSNPYSSMIYMALVGWLISLSFKTKSEKSNS